MGRHAQKPGAFKSKRDLTKEHTIWKGPGKVAVTLWGTNHSNIGIERRRISMNVGIGMGFDRSVTDKTANMYISKPRDKGIVKKSRQPSRRRVKQEDLTKIRDVLAKRLAIIRKFQTEYVIPQTRAKRIRELEKYETYLKIPGHLKYHVPETN